MDRAIRTNRAPQIVATATLAALVLTLSPSKTSRIDARGVAAKAMVISAPRLSPAFAAIEDTFKDWSPTEDDASRNETDKDKDATPLTPGVSAHIVLPEESRAVLVAADIPLGGRIVLKLEQLVETPAPQPVIKVPTVLAQTSLKGMTIRRPEAVEKAPMAAPQPLMLAREEESSDLRGITLTQPKHADLVQEFSRVDLTQPTIKSRMQVLVERELKKQEDINPGQRIVESSMGGGILVATQAPPSEVQAPALPPASPASAMAPARKSESRPALSSVAREEGQIGGRTDLAGHIEITGGLAYTGINDKIEVFREVSGVRFESGQIWLAEGRFALAAGSMTGNLVAELRTKNGEVFGRGELNLRQIATLAGSPKVEGLKIALKPVVSGAKISAISAYSYGDQEIPVATAKVLIESEHAPLQVDVSGKYFTESGFIRGSSFIARAGAENHWGTLAIGVAAEETKLRLFPNRMMDALLNLTLGEDRKLAANSAVIWGRVTKNGAPIAGARVEMAGDHRLQPIYFNNLMLPDRFAEGTGENGMFAFVWVTPGIQSVRVQYQDSFIPAQFMPAEAGNVSYLEFQVGDNENSTLELTDPFDTGLPLNGTIRLAADETHAVEIQGRGQFQFPHAEGQMMLDADVGDLYEVGRLTVSRMAKQILFPMVRRDWMQSIASRKRINIGAGVGAVVGFVSDDDFTVRISVPEGQDNIYQPDIVYFNARGDVSFADEGVAGGGFAVFNVAAGLRTITIVAKSSGKILTQLLVCEPGVVNIVRPPSLEAR